jgi:serine protease
VTPALDNHYVYWYTGQGVTAYVLDTEVNSNTDIAGRLVRSINFATVNGVRNQYDTGDCYGHGTKVATILGGTTYGVAKGVSLVNVKTIGCVGTTPVSDFVDAIDWIVSDYQNHTGPAVINASLSFLGGSQSVDEAVMRTLNAGITFVCSAGNEGVDACGSSPGRLSIPGTYSPNPNQYRTLNVSGTTMNDTFFSGLNYGPCVSILAPGQNNFTIDEYGNQTFFSYTSSAAPFVAGVAALHLERFPTATPSVIGAYIKNNGTPNRITG